MLHLHKEAVPLCEEGMTPAKAQSALLVPQFSNFAIITKPQMKIGKIGKHCIDCGQDNHNVEMCIVKKKKEPTIN
jgi:hypothetical protein